MPGGQTGVIRFGIERSHFCYSHTRSDRARPGSCLCSRHCHVLPVLYRPSFCSKGTQGAELQDLLRHDAAGGTLRDHVPLHSCRVQRHRIRRPLQHRPSDLSLTQSMTCLLLPRPWTAKFWSGILARCGIQALQVSYCICCRIYRSTEPFECYPTQDPRPVQCLLHRNDAQSLLNN